VSTAELVGAIMRQWQQGHTDRTYRVTCTVEAEDENGIVMAHTFDVGGQLELSGIASMLIDGLRPAGRTP
jgi:hypothetical protein